MQVLAKHHPGLEVHGDIKTLDLSSSAKGPIDIVLVSTPCVDLSSRGAGQAQLGQVCRQLPASVLLPSCMPSCMVVDCNLASTCCAQDSNLFFTAVEKVKQYAASTGHLPMLVSENVQGRRFRHWDKGTVRSRHLHFVDALVLFLFLIVFVLLFILLLLSLLLFSLSFRSLVLFVHYDCFSVIVCLSTQRYRQTIMLSTVFVQAIVVVCCVSVFVCFAVVHLLLTVISCSAVV